MKYVSLNHSMTLMLSVLHDNTFYTINVNAFAYTIDSWKVLSRIPRELLKAEGVRETVCYRHEYLMASTWPLSLPGL